MIGVSMNSILSKDRHEEANENKTFIVREEIKQKLYPMLNVGIEIANENKTGNIFCFGVRYQQGFNNNTLLHVYNNENSSSPRFDLGFKGSYIGVSVTYLFNPANFKKDEQFFY